MTPDLAFGGPERGLQTRFERREPGFWILELSRKVVAVKYYNEFGNKTNDRKRAKKFVPFNNSL